MAILKQPPAIHTAFNPAMLHISTATNEAVVSISVTVAGKTITREREALNKVAMFDLSKIINKYFVNTKTIANTFIYKDQAIYLPYSVVADGVTLNFTAINAVAQIGQSSDMTTKKGTFLTTFDKIRKYEGYECFVSVLNHEPTTYVAFMPYNNPGTAPTQLPAFSVSVVDNKNSVVISDTSTFTVQRSLPIENACTPDNPFYVRWINQQGGWDHWMFSFRQLIKRDITNEQTFRPTIYDQQTTTGTTQLVNLEGVEKITAGAVALDAKEYEAVSKLVYSPIIEWFKEDIGKWVSLIVDDGESVNDTHNPSKGIEFTFLLPDPQLQF